MRRILIGTAKWIWVCGISVSCSSTKSAMMPCFATCGSATAGSSYISRKLEADINNGGWETI